MKTLAVLAVALLFVGSAAAALRSYEGESILRVRVPTPAHVDALELFIEQNLLDEWASNAVKGYIDVRVPANLMPAFEALGLKYEHYIKDLQALVRQEQSRIVSRKGRKVDIFNEYPNYDEIVEFWDDLAASFPSLVTRINIGTTYEGRQIPGIRLRGRNPTKGFFFNGGQHAREWVTVPTVLGAAHYLATGYGNNTEVTTFLDNIEFTIVAPLNPDGYSFTWTDDRMWRKNREPNGGVCVGTDTNRNWGYKWATGGSSSQPCSDTYHGPSAMSSREVKAVDTYLTSRKNAGVTYHAYIDFHAYSQLFMSPYGAERALPADYDAQMTVLNNIASAILNTGYNTRYEVGPVFTTIYQASGGSNDHAYGLQNIIYSFAAEGRDTGRYGFLLPEDQITPSIDENWNAIKVVANAVLNI